jgi:hypothetical protein
MCVLLFGFQSRVNWVFPIQHAPNSKIKRRPQIIFLLISFSIFQPHETPRTSILSLSSLPCSNPPLVPTSYLPRSASKPQSFHYHPFTTGLKSRLMTPGLLTPPPTSLQRIRVLRSRPIRPPILPIEQAHGSICGGVFQHPARGDGFPELPEACEWHCVG